MTYKCQGQNKNLVTHTKKNTAVIERVNKYILDNVQKKSYTHELQFVLFKLKKDQFFSC